MKRRVKVTKVEAVGGSSSWSTVTLEYRTNVQGHDHTKTVEVVMNMAEWNGANPPHAHEWPPQIGDEFDMAIIP